MVYDKNKKRDKKKFRVFEGKIFTRKYKKRNEGMNEGMNTGGMKKKSYRQAIQQT